MNQHNFVFKYLIFKDPVLSAGQGPAFVRSCCSNKQWFVTATAHLTDSFLAHTATWSLVTAARASFYRPMHRATLSLGHQLIDLVCLGCFSNLRTLYLHIGCYVTLYSQPPPRPPPTHTRHHHHHHHHHQNQNQKIQLSSVVMDLETRWRTMHTCCIPK